MSSVWSRYVDPYYYTRREREGIARLYRTAVEVSQPGPVARARREGIAERERSAGGGHALSVQGMHAAGWRIADGSWLPGLLSMAGEAERVDA